MKGKKKKNFTWEAWVYEGEQILSLPEERFEKSRPRGPGTENLCRVRISYRFLEFPKVVRTIEKNKSYGLAIVNAILWILFIIFIWLCGTGQICEVIK